MHAWLQLTFPDVHCVKCLFLSPLTPLIPFHFHGSGLKTPPIDNCFSNLLIFSLKPPTYCKLTDTFSFSSSTYISNADLSFLLLKLFQWKFRYHSPPMCCRRILPECFPRICHTLTLSNIFFKESFDSVLFIYLLASSCRWEKDLLQSHEHSSCCQW